MKPQPPSARPRRQPPDTCRTRPRTTLPNGNHNVTCSPDRADDIATNRVERTFARKGPDQLWVIDITEHPTSEGKVYCCAVLNTFSHGIVGWSIDSSPTGAIVTNALGMPS